MKWFFLFVTGGVIINSAPYFDLSRYAMFMDSLSLFYSYISPCDYFLYFYLYTIYLSRWGCHNKFSPIFCSLSLCNVYGQFVLVLFLNFYLYIIYLSRWWCRNKFSPIFWSLSLCNVFGQFVLVLFLLYVQEVVTHFI